MQRGLSMRRFWWAARYAWLTTRHKVFVLQVGLKVGCPFWRLLVHDMSRYGPSELFAYGRQFFGDQGDALGFAYAWLHHQRTNRHHWEAWILVTGHTRGGYPDGQPLPMPEGCWREMIADWIGASRAYEGRWPQDSDWAWFRVSFNRKVRVAPETRRAIMLALHAAFPRAQWLLQKQE